MSELSYRNPFQPGLASTGDSRNRRWMWFTLAPLIWGFPCLVIIAIAIAASGGVFLPAYMAGVAPVAGIYFGIWITFIFRRAIRSMRKRNGEIVISFIEAAIRLNLPLTPFLLAAQRSERGTRAKQIARVRESLNSGSSITSALQSTRDIPQDAIDVIAAYEPFGQLKTALSRLLKKQEVSAADDPGSLDRSLYRTYPLFILFCSGALTFFFIVFILPKFREMFRDFEVKLPPLTQHLIALSDWFSDYWILLLLFAAVFSISILLYMSLSLHEIFFRFAPLPNFRPFIDGLKWRVPILRGIQRDRGMAETCELLADALAAGVPLHTALQNSMTLPINPGFKKQLAQFREGLMQGRAPGDAARAAGLPELLAGMLNPMNQEANSALFDFLSRHYRQRFSRTTAAIAAAVEPVFVLCAGSLVLYLVLALFLPVIALLNSTIQKGGSVL
ncbi:MAG TPA: type II secretion system F family protein [Phycisphaerae bacterium]|jgi:type II secretory pathway component PulF